MARPDDAFLGFYARASQDAQLKALLAHPAVPREVSAAGLAFYLTRGYSAAPLTILQGVRKSLAAQVRAANEINGALVAARLKHNQAAITALQTAARNNTGVYGPDGGTRLTASTTRALASA